MANPYLPSTTSTLPATWGTGFTMPTSTWTPYVIRNTSQELHEHYIFKLPKNKLPLKIYINGGLKTIGIVGSLAEVAYLGKNKVCINKKAFSPTLALYTELTISLEYKTAIYHYCTNAELLYNDHAEIKAIFLSKQAI